MSASPQVIEQALAQVERGFAAFALAANGKRPVTLNGFKDATRDPAWVRRQLEAASAGNYGIVWPEDAPECVVVLDLDNGSDGRERPWQSRLLELIEKIGALPPTKSTTTPSGGRHAFYRWPDDVDVPAGDELFGFTVRWPGRGYLVGPGSSIDGVPYVEGPTPEIAELPRPWVEAALAERASAPRRDHPFIAIRGGRFELPDVIPSGRRYATIRDYVASRYNSGLSVDELWELVRTQVAPRFRVQKTEADLRADFDRVTDKLAERLGPPRRAAEPDIPAGPLEDAPLTAFESAPIEWLWPSWLPRGVVTLMDGNPGVSKSTLVTDLVARLTTGRAWPDGAPQSVPPSRVMWITTEDDPGRVIRPRLEAAGGDPALVRFVTSEVVFPSGAGAFRELLVRRSAEAGGLVLVVLDPLFSHLDAGVKTIADSEMRKGVMNPLQDAAEAAGAAILVVRHFSKDTSASALQRGAGSLGGIVGAARALWSVVADPADESGQTKAIGVAKLNYARIPPALRYQVVSKTPPGWISGTVSAIEWLGASELSIDELMADPDRKTASSLDALREILGGGGLAAGDVASKMRSRGFGDTALRRARKLLGIEPRKSGMTGGWVWELPAEDVEDVPGTPSTSSQPSRARARGGIQTDSTSSTSSTSSGVSGQGAEDVEDVEGVPLRAGAPAREGEWLEPCRWYADHRSVHRRTPTGWTCDACTPPVEKGAIA